MKAFLLIASLTCTLAVSAFAQANDDVLPLSYEEVRLVEAFRDNPEPFRRVLYGSNHEAEQTAATAILGPRDVIDVTVADGKIAFYGKRRDYSPASIRMVRGETAYLVFGRDGSSAETRVRVAYRADGLHFDVREPQTSSSAAPRGFIVIPESVAWRRGDVIPWAGRLDDAYSLSRAENITFRVRYASR